MPEPIVRHGLKGNQNDAAKGPAGVVFPTMDPREPGETEDDLVFESKYDFYRVQVNSPEVAVNLVTGTKTKMKNRYIQFVNGVFIPKGEHAKEDLKALLASSSFGQPGTHNFWLRKDRQKKEVNSAITTLIDQLKSRPDLVSLVSKRLSDLNISTKRFAMPKPPRESQDNPPAPAGQNPPAPEGNVQAPLEAQGPDDPNL